MKIGGMHIGFATRAITFCIQIFWKQEPTTNKIPTILKSIIGRELLFLIDKGSRLSILNDNTFCAFDICNQKEILRMFHSEKYLYLIDEVNHHFFITRTLCINSYALHIEKKNKFNYN